MSHKFDVVWTENCGSLIFTSFIVRNSSVQLELTNYLCRNEVMGLFGLIINTFLSCNSSGKLSLFITRFNGLAL